MAESLINEIHRIRVSSVLNNDTKQFGKKFLTDGNEETCWNSDQSTQCSGQWIAMEFTRGVLPEELHLVFQGGFAGKRCQLQAILEGQDTYSSILDFFPEDDNSRQIEKLEKKVTKLKILLSESTDFYGRVTVYTLDILGRG